MTILIAIIAFVLGIIVGAAAVLAWFVWELFGF